MGENWRERYLELAEEHERDGERYAQAERELTRLITRVCVAVSGLDPALDPHLERLRKAAKGGKAAAVLDRAGEFADALVRAGDERTKPSVVQRLFEHAKLDRRRADKALSAWAKVAADPASASPSDLDRLSAALREAVDSNTESASPRGGLLTRIMGRGSAPDGPTPNRILVELIDAMPWPEGMRHDVDECRAMLGDDAAADAWTGVVRRVGEIAVSALDEAQANARSAESFLAELSRRLETLDQHMLDEVSRGDESRESGERLGRNMSNEVESLSDRVRESASLADLQASVLASLDRMQSHVREHLDEENARREKAENEAKALREELHTLERDTFDLRREIAQTQEQALRDALTGLPNRRAYDERVEQERARLRRFGDPLALLVLDVDNFKGINDTYGHKAGDKALAMIAGILRGRLRATDFIARFGGEEFVLLLIGAQREDALKVADLMRTSVEQGGLHAKGQPVSLTVSGGLTMVTNADTADGAFERADQALYQAKQQGKNRIVVS